MTLDCLGATIRVTASNPDNDDLRVGRRIGYDRDSKNGSDLECSAEKNGVSWDTTSLLSI